MNYRYITIGLWVAVIFALGWMWLKEPNSPEGENAEIEWVILSDVPWKHFQTVQAFELTDQDGKTFDSAELSGKPYALNIFFSNCPTACWSLNQQVKRLTEKFEGKDAMFLSMTCDPTNDTAKVLKEYAGRLEARESHWKFLTGSMYDINQLGQCFGVDLKPQSHTESILVVDKWGRYRDRFDWNDPHEMERFASVMNQLLDEKEPPLDQSFLTRNKLAASELTKGMKATWLREFELIDSDGNQFYSKDKTGSVWMANFFFTSCPTICPRMNEYVSGLLDRMKKQTSVEMASISIQPISDVPARLRQYQRERGFEKDNWHFLTGEDEAYIRKIGNEFFGELAAGEDHSSMICLVDRWGNLRGKYNWNHPEFEPDFINFCKTLAAEKQPPAKWKIRKFTKSAGD